MNYNSIYRIRIITVIVSLSALIIIGRLYNIQILNGDKYSQKADNQYIKPSSSIFDRGSIFFSSKDGTEIAAATVKEGYILSINPAIIKNPDQVFEALSQYMDLNEADFLEKAMRSDSVYAKIVSRLSKDIGESIKSLKIIGVNVDKENWRVYPGGSLSAQTIGIIGYDKQNILAGRYGLESYYEDVLSRVGVGSNINFFAELFSGIKESVFESKDVAGDIVTSIEPTVESYLEEILEDTQSKWKSDSIGGIIMDPKTGEIYAMAQLPTFNPNDLSEVKNPEVFSNSLIEGAYEMGSIIKPLSVASGIDSGAIKAGSTYNDEGFLLLSGRRISNYDGKARGVVPIQEILSQSLNTGVAHIALKMGSKEFSEYFFSFGLGKNTGIDQPNEQKGIIKSLETKRDIEIATASYGQGISMTPIQTIRALAVLANNGILVTPHLTKNIEYLNGDISKPAFKEPIQVLKKETVEDVTRMLVNVVDKALKGGEAKMEHYSIAAKTGTAQIADPVNGGYYNDRYLHSFFGYFPAYDPKFIVFLYHIYPKGAEYASETLTDPFIQLTKLLINYYEIPPDR